MSLIAVHQAVDTLAPGSAVSNCVLSIQDILCEAGYLANVHALNVQPGIDVENQSLFWRRPTKKLWLYHFSVGSSLTRRIQRRAQREDVVLWYHNLTPLHYFRASDPLLAGRLAAGRQELAQLAETCQGAIADSAFNARELEALGYKRIRVVPPLFFDSRYEIPPTPSILGRFAEVGPVWLFVGRLVPNKAQTEIITAFHAFKRLHPTAQLVLVGSAGASVTYFRWLRNQIAFLGLSPAVHLVGHVSQADLNAYYRIADCFVSMSEHEGFGIPLVESLYFDLPVLAYDAAAVGETLGDAGILIRTRDPFLVAELAHLLVTDAAFRNAIQTQQRRRLHDFDLDAVTRRLLESVRGFLGEAS
jgi:glycosyltransferase involved in cell wall biosynthesis